jgi:hexosaminidase
MLTRSTEIHATPGAAAVAEHLAAILRPSTGYPLPVEGAPPGTAVNGVALTLTGTPDAVALAGTPETVDGEGYTLDITAGAIVIRAARPAGLFFGVQTLRQLLPVKAESAAAQEGPWIVPGGQIVDRPRFEYRSTMLDVARHFFPIDAVKRYIDQVSRYKINYLHLHLTDDQGWRIAIESWPRLADYGGSTAVDGDLGGYYTREEYAEIVAYAGQRHITVVPEIDLPGHVNAALAAYPELNCDGVAPPLYTGTEVGFSSLCADKEITYRFVDDVIRELAALTPGPYVHIGGDEANATSAEDYATFMHRTQRIVAAHGKQPLAWHQILGAAPPSSTTVQYWGASDADKAVAAAAPPGTRFVLSPATRTYLDMKYTPSTALGQDWAGVTEVRDAYDWDPGRYVDGVDESAVLGVEAPLWTEDVRTSADIEYLAFPRLPAIAELGWSPAATHDWKAFSQRLGAQRPRWDALGINYYRSPQVPWR